MRIDIPSQEISSLVKIIVENEAGTMAGLGARGVASLAIEDQGISLLNAMKVRLTGTSAREVSLRVSKKRLASVDKVDELWHSFCQQPFVRLANHKALPKKEGFLSKMFGMCDEETADVTILLDTWFSKPGLNLRSLTLNPQHLAIEIDMDGANPEAVTLKK